MFDMVLNAPLKTNSDKYHLISISDTSPGTSSGHLLVKNASSQELLGVNSDTLIIFLEHISYFIMSHTHLA